MLLHHFKKELRALAHPNKAKILRHFFKTGKGEYGAGDKFLGIVVPDIRRLVRRFWLSVSLSEIKLLLHSPYHEERLASLLVLVEKFKYGSKDEQKSIFWLYVKNIKKYINNWDLVDLTAPHIVGSYVFRHVSQIQFLTRLARSSNLWERRVAILSTFYFLRQQNYHPTVRIAKILLLDPHDLIHKATGWMLREMGKRCSFVMLDHFLHQYAHQMPRTMLRYSLEHYPTSRRIFWLNYKKK